MCCPITTTFAAKVTIFFKAIEWIFVLCVAWMGASLIFPKFAFNACINCLNWLIKQQNLDGTLSGNEKAFRQFRRDIWILFVLEIIVIILIELL